jgi:hypothetical protein
MTTLRGRKGEKPRGKIAKTIASERTPKLKTHGGTSVNGIHVKNHNRTVK